MYSLVLNHRLKGSLLKLRGFSLHLIPLQYSAYTLQPPQFSQMLIIVSSTQQSHRTLLDFLLQERGWAMIGPILFDFLFSKITVLHYALCNILKPLFYIFLSGFLVVMAEGQFLYQLTFQGQKWIFWHPTYIFFKSSGFIDFSYIKSLLWGFFPL